MIFRQSNSGVIITSVVGEMYIQIQEEHSYCYIHYFGVEEVSTNIIQINWVQVLLLSFWSH
jgi:hypothetical protein